MLSLHRHKAQHIESYSKKHAVFALLVRVFGMHAIFSFSGVLLKFSIFFCDSFQSTFMRYCRPDTTFSPIHYWNYIQLWNQFFFSLSLVRSFLQSYFVIFPSSSLAIGAHFSIPKNGGVIFHWLHFAWTRLSYINLQIIHFPHFVAFKQSKCCKWFIFFFLSVLFFSFAFR